MAETKISSADATDMRNIDQTSDTATDFRRTVDTAIQDYPGTKYYPDWAKWFGFYKNIPELQASIIKLTEWVVGKGYEADDGTKKKLDRIRGCGKDSFDSVIFNLQLSKKICGDSFAEVVRNKRGNIINLKPINPGSMVIWSNRNGIITQYEQVARYSDDKGTERRKSIIFKPEQMFHLINNRLGDEPHGRSDIEKLENIISMKKEAMTDMRIVFHRYVKPLIISQIDSDDEAEIAAYKTKLDNAVRYMENMIIPKGTVEMERMSIPQYSTLDPLPWIGMLQQLFVVSEGMPEVIMGFGRETTEASAKILYLAFQQKIESEQLYLEQQLKNQLKLDVEFNFPESIAPELAEDVSKERNMNNLKEN